MGFFFSAYVRHHVEMLQAANSVGILQKSSEALFGSDGAFAIIDDEDKALDLTEADEVSAMNNLKSERQKYRSQKIHYDQMQCLLKSMTFPSSISESLKSSASSFYSDAWPAASALIAPFVEIVHEKTKKLLVESQDHPALLKILELVSLISSIESTIILYHSLFSYLPCLLFRPLQFRIFPFFIRRQSH